MWYIIQCKRLNCSKYLIVKAYSKSKRCPYCGITSKVNDAYISRYQNQIDARDMLKRFNSRI